MKSKFNILVGIVIVMHFVLLFNICFGREIRVPQDKATISTAISIAVNGDIILIDSGEYIEPTLSISKSITIKNAGNELPIVRIARLDTAWELVDNAKMVYRSLKTFSGLSEARGYFYANNTKYRLVPYVRFGDLISDNENYTSSDYTYVGPGTYYNSSEGKIYIRLKHSWIQENVVNLPYPQDINPNNNVIELYPDKDLFNITGSNISIEGLKLRSGNRVFVFGTAANNVSIKNCDILGGKTHIYVPGGTHHLTFDGITIDDCCPPWIAWQDVKIKITVGGLTDYVAGSLKLAGFNIQDNVNFVEIKNCVINNTFDGILYTKGHDLKVINCAFNGTRDDGMELDTGAYNIEITHNKFLKLSKAISRQDYGNSPVQPGTKYIHHNIIDCDVKLLHGRTGSTIYSKTDRGLLSNTAFGSHGNNNPGIGDPWKMYNNTIKIGHAVSGTPSEKGIGCEYSYDQFIVGNPQEIYNNIFLQTTDNRLIQDVRTSDGSQVFDGNIYWRYDGRITSSFYRYKKDGTTVNLLDLNALKLFSSNFEKVGLEVDPLLDFSFVPLEGSLALTKGIDLSGKGWPDSDSNYRGAIGTQLPPPPPPPIKKYSCSGIPDYQCAEDINGLYSTIEECQSACKPTELELLRKDFETFTATVLQDLSNIDTRLKQLENL